MKADALFMADLSDYPATAKAAEAAGFDGVMSPELAHDPFLPLVSAATTTSSVDLVTGIAVAFARSPMTVAVTSADIHRLSEGRLVLGLGTQVKAHITRRYSMEWSRPAVRMREYICALRAIWTAWNEGTPLAFEGEFYRHTLMTPVFDPGPSPVGDPKILLAAVGPAMTAVAGEVADGLLLHAFTTPAYARDVTMPSLQVGLVRSARDRSDLEVSIPAMAIIADTEEAHEAKTSAARAQLAFYGSTPSYRPVLAHHGWGALGEELHRLSKSGDWTTMAGLVDDEVLYAFSVIAETPEAAGAEIAQRYGSIVDRVQIAFDPASPDDSARLVAAIRSSVSPEVFERTHCGKPALVGTELSGDQEL
ncbi:TIGR03617 family F420-dependent LLM class oxidoreductase [Mycobacterium sp. WUMAC-067]|uniref:TIGR03617 family F420-dependent LLM class oxidoreductase n=1 Tax=unclassified Mycobacterium TaxID=2642494 RepID=UPI001CD93466|nr:MULTISPECIES: TIGR03617 family F420-dependent LLM class oxidoreductase [unclassified Mycobacterium]MCA2244783.1 TIGR03617 family F420-dependent LLM class oxidoreductase [Mycobacterium sp. WUMAC-067]MCA2315993.1 TIGR03617 family F420-dependent LLM class oxidoreductase [Mycobacterium sp. WUMAC-025]